MVGENGFKLVSFLEVPDKEMKNISVFLSNNQNVRTVSSIETVNYVFPSRFNILVQSVHNSDVEGIRFHQDLKNAFKLKRIVGFELCKN